jgi:hypothetical protein
MHNADSNATHVSSVLSTPHKHATNIRGVQVEPLSDSCVMLLLQADEVMDE